MVILGFVQGGIIMAIVGVTILASILRFQAGLWTVGDIVMINGLLLQTISPLQRFAASYKNLIGAFAMIKNLHAVLKNANSPVVVPPTIHADLGIALQARNLSVSLGNSKIIECLDCSMKEGEFLAIIGESGSGKSTLAKALAGLLEVEGTISVSPRVRRVAYLNQEAEIFDLDIANNVSLCETPNATLLEQSLRNAGLSKEDITNIGNRSLGERGRNVAGGQRQRIGLARMLYHHADVLILDEPTASLDEKTAARVMDTIQKIATTRTILLITHDLKLAALADRTLRMEGGRLFEETKANAVLVATDRA
jgi:ABC-type multidrug transport system fused ATPase/permease subunit